MLNFLLRRILWMIPSFFAVSVVAFTIIQLPPGDFVTSYAADLATSGSPASAEQLQELRVRYGLDQSMLVHQSGIRKWRSSAMPRSKPMVKSAGS